MIIAIWNVSADATAVVAGTAAAAAIAAATAQWRLRSQLHHDRAMRRRDQTTTAFDQIVEKALDAHAPAMRVSVLAFEIHVAEEQRDVVASLPQRTNAQDALLAKLESQLRGMRKEMKKADEKGRRMWRTVLSDTSRVDLRLPNKDPLALAFDAHAKALGDYRMAMNSLTPLPYDHEAYAKATKAFSDKTEAFKEALRTWYVED